MAGFTAFYIRSRFPRERAKLKRVVRQIVVYSEVASGAIREIQRAFGDPANDCAASPAVDVIFDILNHRIGAIAVT